MEKIDGATLNDYEVVIAGSGAGGLSAAVACRVLGLRTLVLEASKFLGGCTALSGGVIWIPRNPVRTASPQPDTVDDAIAYIRAEAGEYFDRAATESFVASAAPAIEFLADNGGLAYTGPAFWPDYHPGLAGARHGGRSMRIDEFDGRLLGRLFEQLRPPLSSMTLFAGMMVSGNDLYHLLRARRSITSALHVVKILCRHGIDRLNHDRGTRLCNGSALAARLLHRYVELGGDLAPETALDSIQLDQHRVTGCVLRNAAGETSRLLCSALILAGGGLGGQHGLRRALADASAVSRQDSISLSPDSVRGSNIQAALAIGARIDARQHDVAAWVPVSTVTPAGDESPVFYPHFFDRSKPGFILVDSSGHRFVNEASSYHDIGARMKSLDIQTAYIVCDHPALRRYGVGVVPPGTPRVSRWIDSGYLTCAHSIEALAQRLGIHEQTLGATLQRYNQPAAQGVDPDFHKGESPYDRYIGDPDHHPNPCIAPLARAPFYAVKVRLGDIGTFCGLATEPSGRVLSQGGDGIDGLYAVGNDRASLFGGTYPAAGITLGPALTHGVITAHHIANRPWPRASQGR